jgi:hypothetical protein
MRQGQRKHRRLRADRDTDVTPQRKKPGAVVVVAAIVSAIRR